VLRCSGSLRSTSGTAKPSRCGGCRARAHSPPGCWSRTPAGTAPRVVATGSAPTHPFDPVRAGLRQRASRVPAGALSSAKNAPASSPERPPRACNSATSRRARRRRASSWCSAGGFFARACSLGLVSGPSRRGESDLRHEGQDDRGAGGRSGQFRSVGGRPVQVGGAACGRRAIIVSRDKNEMSPLKAANLQIGGPKRRARLFGLVNRHLFRERVHPGPSTAASSRRFASSPLKNIKWFKFTAIS